MKVVIGFLENETSTSLSHPSPNSFLTQLLTIDFSAASGRLN